MESGAEDTATPATPANALESTEQGRRQYMQPELPVAAGDVGF
jgi:hypothetical protein